MSKQAGRITRSLFLFRLFLVLLLCLVGQGELQAEHVFSHPEAGFAISLPEEWIAIPRQELTSRQQMIAGNSRTFKESAYQAAFQLRGREWFAYPYVLVTVNRKGRIPQPRIPRFNSRIDENLDTLETGGQSLASSRLLKSGYEPKTHVYAAEALIEIKDDQLLSLLHEVCYTSQGFLQFSLFSKQEDYSVYAPVLKKAISSLELSGETLYTSSLMDKLPLLADFRFQDLASPLLTSLAIGLLLVIVGIAYVRLKDRKH